MRALSADVALLRSPGQQRLQGRVHSVFDRVVNVMDVRGELFTLACRDVDDAPDTIVVDTHRFRGAGLAPGDAVQPSACGITLAHRLEIRLDNARPWVAALPAFPPDDAVLRANLETLRRQVAARAFGGGMPASALPSCMPALLARRTAMMKTALAAGDLAAAARHGAALLGLGPGLTPSGDDYLVGLFAVLHMPHSPCAALASVCGAVLGDVQERTHPISGAALKAAARGRVRASLVALLHALVHCPPRRTAAALRRVLAIGSSSGADMAAGLLDGLEVALARRALAAAV